MRSYGEGGHMKTKSSAIVIAPSMTVRPGIAKSGVVRLDCEQIASPLPEADACALTRYNAESAGASNGYGVPSEAKIATRGLLAGTNSL